MVFEWILIGVISIILIILFISLQIAFSVVTPKKRSLAKTRQIENDRDLGLMEFYDQNLHDEYDIESVYGYKLRLYFFINPNESNKYIVMAHGHTYTHHGCIKYAKMMFNHGYNVVLYDERFHGNSGGKNTTLGYFEKNDLYEVITNVEKRFGKDIIIGTYGESMGGATVLLEQDFDNRVKFVISDCAFASLSRLLKELMKYKLHLPIFLFLPLTNFFIKMISKMNIYNVNPIESLNNNNIPILFVHGEGDRLINYHHSLDMFNKYEGPKMYMLGKNNAKHAESYPNNVQEYEDTVSKFLKDFVEKTGKK
jgi:uncharacterized protein